MARGSQSKESLSKPSTSYLPGNVHALLFVILLQLTALSGLVQSLSVFFFSSSRVALSVSQGWFYFVYSSVFFLLFTRHSVIHLCTRIESEVAEIVFLLLHCHLAIIADMTFLVYLVCNPFLITGKSTQIFNVHGQLPGARALIAGFNVGVAAIYGTLLTRVALCMLFIKLAKRKLVFA